MEQYDSQRTLVFYVNGMKVVDNNPDPRATLLEYLRNKVRLCGVKLGCGEGGCGACTVMVSKFDRVHKRIEHMSVNACLALAVSMHGLAVTTVEGIGSTKTRMHVVQQRLFEAHGSQCGFCTPGIIMSMYTLLRQHPQPSNKLLQDAFQGNLCRCTGYRPIIQSFKGFADCCNSVNGGCCRNNQNVVNEEDDIATELMEQFPLPKYDPTQEPIFPPELQMSSELDVQSLRFESGGVTWFRPTSLDELLNLKANHPEAKVTVGNTEVGVEIRNRKLHYPALIYPSAITQLTAVHHSSEGIVFGAATSLTTVQRVLQEALLKYPEYKTRVFLAVLEILHLFAGPQIRNVATLAGNLVTASPISDLNPLLLASSARIEVASVHGRRRFFLDANFFRGYRRTALNPEDVIVSVLIPFTTRNEYFAAFKQSQRREDDIAIVNAAMRVVFHPNAPIVKDIRLSFGGVAPTTALAVATMNALREKPWDESMLSLACNSLSREFPLDISTPGGMPDYRQTLVLSFFFKFYLRVIGQLDDVEDVPVVMDSYKSANFTFHSDPPKASQVYQLVPSGQRAEDPIGRPIPHHTAKQQTTGEAVYCDDMAPIEGELHLAYVMSTEAHAKILSVDAEGALAMEGVKAFVSAEDLPGEKNWAGVMVSDEEIFASKKVAYQGQVIGVIVAEDKFIAQQAAQRVRVEYEPISPVILSIEDAIAAEQYFPDATRCVRVGNVEAALAEAEHVLRGEMRVGGQNHFYLEPQAGRAIPKGEQDEIELTISSQSPNAVQLDVAKALGIPANRVVVKVKRLGGGFGGKETRTTALSLPLAVAAAKVGKPVRFSLDRDEDMIMVGGRHPFLIRYEVGVSSEGRIVAVKADLYSNGGSVLDLSSVVMDTAITKLDCAYRIPNAIITGRVCKTNLPTNTAFRGFGAPQMIVWMESLMQDIATVVGADPLHVREINMNDEGDEALYGTLTYCTVRRCWNECFASSDFKYRRDACIQFNRENRWKKRGLALIPLKYGIGYPFPFLNQGCALVHIYTDGSVLVTHGGVEMGQGLHIKMIQVASRALGIPASKIHISETSTDKTPNATQTAASFSSDLFGMAILNACKTLLHRLEPIMMAKPKASWEEWISDAYSERVNLSATGFYRSPGEPLQLESRKGDAFQYFSYGAACSEVEVDCLTGDHQVLRTDIVMDVGESLNPAIDVGQIEGAFVQGYGLFTLEQLRYSSTGALLTRGPGAYKIPGFDDIPNVLNVALLKGSPNIHAVYSSKAIGEPPLLLAASVFLAIKDAVTAARSDAAISGIFRMDSPATAERIRMCCEDEFTAQVSSSNAERDVADKKPWEITV